MGIQIPLKTIIQQNPHEIPDEFHRFPFYFVIMIPNFTETETESCEVKPAEEKNVQKAIREAAKRNDMGSAKTYDRLESNVLAVIVLDLGIDL
ncbi:hypothetical protein LXL04_023679 [Taraxacum kok-saghyz]